MKSLSLESASQNRIKSIESLKNESDDCDTWWSRQRAEARLCPDLKKVGLFIFQDSIWDTMPSADQWTFLMGAYDELQLVTKIFEAWIVDKVPAISALYEQMSLKLYIFGGALAFGFWDGKSDVDFCYIPAKEASGTTRPITSFAPMFVRKFVKLLKVIGWHHMSVLPIVHAKVPVVKHKKGRFRRSNITGLDISVPLEHSAEKISKIQAIAEDSNLMYADSVTNLKTNLIQYYAPSPQSVLRAYASVVPFSKFLRPHFFDPPKASTVDFDLSFDERGIRNSWLIRQYLFQSNIARQGALYVKCWSKTASVNDGRQGYLCSYAWVIMWIYYITFEKNFLAYVDPETIPAIPGECEDYTKLFKSLGYVDKQSQVLSELIYGFFEYYTTYFDWARDVVSLNRGVTRKSLSWDRTKIGNTFLYMCIQDPYIKDLTLGRALNEQRATETISTMKMWVSSARMHAQSTNSKQN